MRGSATILAVVLALVSTLWLFSHTTGKVDIALPSQTSIKANIVEKDTVVNALAQKAQWVGMEGKIEKQFTYTDSTLETKYEAFNSLGKRQYNFKLNGSFKLGFDMSEITPDRIIIRDDTVIIVSPKVILISLDIPYDRMEIVGNVGIFRTELKDADKQGIYSKYKQQINDELLSDKELINKAREDSQRGISKFLLTIPNVKTVKFI